MINAVLAASLLTANPPIEAFLNPDASISLVQDGRSLGSVSFSVAMQGWNWAGISPTTTDGRFNLGVPGGGTLDATLTRDGDRLRVVYEARITQDVNVESVHASLNLPRNWAGGTVDLGPTRVNLPLTDGDIFLGWASAAACTAASPNGIDRFTTTFANPVASYLQDSRRWGGGFDLRLNSGSQSPTWRAATSVRFDFTVAGNGPIVLGSRSPLKIVAGPNWVPYEHKLDFVAGSALDWSPAKVAPAGGNGRVIVNAAGKFAVAGAPSRNMRFYGSNLAFSAATPDRATAEAVAARLRMAGYNAVRLHHYDVEITGGWWRDNPVPSTTLDPVAMDRFDYLFHQLKRNGIYVKIDLFTIRQFRRNEIVPGILDMDDFKALLLVSPAARENWWTYTRNLLNHRNPYTGNPYRAEPALSWICVVNENNLGSTWFSASDATRALFQQAWVDAGNAGTFSPYSDAGARFAARLHRQTYQWMRDRIRSIGCQALLTDNNGWYEQTAYALNRDQLDWVDNHNYWDHPSFLGAAWGLPSRGGNGGGSAVFDLGGGLPSMGLTRLAGKPFTVSEYQFAAPNRFRGEAGLFVGALAARQDWDALWRFAWAHGEDQLDRVQAFDYFNVQSDPAMMASDRAAVALFKRLDLPMAAASVTQRLDSATVGASNYRARVLREPFANRFQTSLTAGEADPDAVAGNTGAVTYDLNLGILRVNSPRTWGVIAPAGMLQTAGAISARLDGVRGTVTLMSLDGQALVNSRRVLITHITDVQNTNITYTDGRRDVVTDWGTTPHLVRDGRATVWLRHTSPAGLKLWRLDAAGNRVAEIPVRRPGIPIVLDLSTRGPQGATLYYELAG